MYIFMWRIKLQDTSLIIEPFAFSLYQLTWYILRSMTSESCFVLLPHNFLSCRLQLKHWLLLSFCEPTEPIIVEVVFRNPLKVPLALSALSLLWKFTLKDFSGSQGGTTGETITNEKEAASLKEVRLLVISRFIMPKASRFGFFISLINFSAFESVPDHSPQWHNWNASHSRVQHKSRGDQSGSSTFFSSLSPSTLFFFPLP